LIPIRPRRAASDRSWPSRRERTPGTASRRPALVNEVYLRLVEGRSVSWQNRAHFLAVAARLMRRILVDFARAKTVAKARRRRDEGDTR
jgi:hypothetical protein